MKPVFRLAALVLVTLAWPLTTARAAQPAGDNPPRPAAKGATSGVGVEVTFTDNSSLKLQLREDKLELTTPYGKLLVPVADVQRVDFRTRMPDDVLRKVEVLVINLGSSNFREREEASAQLLLLREKAYPALQQAAQGKDMEVVRRAEELLEKIREAVPEEFLEIRKQDVIHTADSKFAGRIDVESFKATTAQFGEVQMKLADVRSLRLMGTDRELADGNAMPDPGSMVNFRDQIGKKMLFKVTGTPAGSLWGTDFYTLDSTLAAAAVHTGALRPGQTGIVRVTIIGPQPAFQGSNRNGVNSANYGAYPGAFRVSK